MTCFHIILAGEGTAQLPAPIACGRVQKGACECLSHVYTSLLPARVRPLLRAQIKKLQEEADGHKAAAAEFSRGLDALTRNPDLPALQRELGDTVRRMAVVQVGEGRTRRGMRLGSAALCAAGRWCRQSRIAPGGGV